MRNESETEFDIAALVILALMILAGLCVWLIVSLPEGFFPAGM
jgi:multidrug efflux pump subunit AcrB